MRSNRGESVLELDKVLALLAERCPCERAKELALSQKPSSSYPEILRLLKETSDAHMLTGRFGSPSFGGINDVSNSLRRAEAGGVLSMRELLAVSSTLRAFRTLRSWRAHSEGIQTSLDGMFMSLTPNKFLEDKINTSIISEEEMSDNASSELADIRRKIRHAQTKVRDQLDKMIRSPSYQKYLQDSIVTIRGGRFVVPVKAECRNDIAGLVHDTSSSGSTVFIEPMGVVQANNDIKVLLAKEETEIERILYLLSAEAAGFADSIISGYNVITELSVIFAKASLAYSMDAVLPDVNADGVIDIKKARHPLIDKSKVVPADIRLGGSFDTLIITGPNTGGKTVTLKTLGLFTLMAQCGLMIPAAEGSRLSVFEHVLADIGDEQSIEQSLSTFSSHMVNIKEIIELSGSGSLILLDELGAGTDPVEGAALAMSILEALRSKGARIAATTHYAELKSYAINTAGVENACCEFDVKTLKPTYRLLIGVPGRSNAFAISERLGIPSDIVNEARSIVSNDSVRFEETVEKLEQSRQKMEEELSEISMLKTDAVKMNKEASLLAQAAEREKQRALDDAKGEAKRIVENARRQAQALLDELEKYRKMKANGDFEKLTAQARTELKGKLRFLEEAADPIQKRDDDKYVLPRELKKGDEVIIYDINKRAVVLTPPDSKGIAEVQAGAMKMRINKTNLRLAEKQKKLERSNVRTNTGRADSSLSTEIDVRGETVDEAIMDIDKFIDSALLMGMETVTIIHGKGTGALRAGIQQHLRRHPNINHFRLGAYGEGESGVTVAKLK